MHTFVDASHCAAPQLRAAAALVHASLPAFYNLFGDVLHVIEKMFGARGTSLEHSTVALAATEAVGIFAAHDVGLLRRVSFSDLQQLLREVAPDRVDQAKAAVRAYSAEVAPLSESGRYLARFAVTPNMRGSGLADALLDRFEAGGNAFYLHVHSGNARAIAFYRRHGYAPFGTPATYSVMRKLR